MGGLRRLRNVCLQYLGSIKGTDDEVTIAAQLAKNHYDKATCMTDKVSALTCLSSMKGGVDGAATDAREDIIARFYNEANGDSLVLNKWFQIQAGADLPDIIDRVKSLIGPSQFYREESEPVQGVDWCVYGKPD